MKKQEIELNLKGASAVKKITCSVVLQNEIVQENVYTARAADCKSRSGRIRAALKTCYHILLVATFSVSVVVWVSV